MKAAGILGVGNKEWRNVAEHLLATNAVAVFVGNKLAQSGVKIDLKTIDQASILHDSTKRLEREQGITAANEHDYSIRGNFLQRFGYSFEVLAATEYTGRVPEIFIDDPEKRREAVGQLPMEWLVVAYADARTRNTDVVSLEEARDLNKEKIPEDAGFYDQWHAFYKDVEDRIMSEVSEPDFGPQSVNNDSVIGMVRSA